jgi:hypothetical protein
MPRKKPARKRKITGAEKNRNDFGKEMEKFGKTMEERFKKSEKKPRFYFFTGPLGILAPLFTAIVGTVLLAIAIAILGWLNYSFLHTVFLASVTDFIGGNLQWFFLFNIFFAYLNFMSFVLDRHWLRPISISAGITVAVWAVNGILQTYALKASNASLLSATSSVSELICPLFAGLLILSYLVLLLYLQMQINVKTKRARSQGRAR